MTAMIMSAPRDSRGRGSFRWVVTTVLIACTPKCLLCTATYASVGAVLGLKLRGAEFCSLSRDPWKDSFPLGAAVLIALILITYRRRTIVVK